MYTENDIVKFKQKAMRIKLEASLLFWMSSAEKLVKICNGIGAESAPEWVREALTWVYRKYQTTAAIHDCDYQQSDGTEAKRQMADQRFHDNCLKEWEDAFGAFRWVRPAALWERNKIRLADKALRIGGKAAWIDAFKENDK